MSVMAVSLSLDSLEGLLGGGDDVLPAVNPNSRNRVAASADAPKWSIPMISPASPTMSRQPWGTPASTETRALTAAGRTFSR